jgi:hypothetical protein
VGRPSKLTPEAKDRFFKAFSTGVFPETAARFAGWSPATFYRYMRGSTPAHAAFRDEVLRAETELEIRLVGTLTRAAFNDPRWAVDLLERRFARRWGRRASLDEPDTASPGRAQSAAGTAIPLDPALVEAIIPRLLEAGERLRGASVDNADPVSRFEVDPRIPGEPPEATR